MDGRIVVFCPYFGKLPDHFHLWLISCGFNTNFEFIVFTDDTRVFDVPRNVSIIHMSWSELYNIVARHFDFAISLKAPYKLCDFKPAYGFIFQEYLSDCSYWGYCDLDLLWGNLNKFIPWEKNADKYSIFGHLSLVKNTDTLRQLFKKKSSHISYRDIFSSSANFGFDELEPYGINSIFDKYGYAVVKLDAIADISPLHCGFSFCDYRNGGVVDNKKKVFKFDNGCIISYSLDNNIVEEKEYMYLHLQKRNMQYCILGKPGTKFLIVPNRFIAPCTVNREFIEANSRLHNYLHKRIKVKLKAGKNKLIRILSVAKIMAKNRGMEEYE